MAAGSRAGISEGERRAQVDVGRLDGQSPAIRHGILGIDREVGDDLLDLRGVGPHRARRARHHGELDVLADQAPEHGHQPRHDGGQVEDARLEHLLAAEREELPREPRGSLRGLLDQLHGVAPGSGGLERVEQELRAAADDGQDVVEVVRDAAGQTSHRLHLLGL